MIDIIDILYRAGAIALRSELVDGKEISVFSVAGCAAFRSWDSLRQILFPLGCWPLLRDGDHVIDSCYKYTDNWSAKRAFTEIVDEAIQIDFDELLQRMRSEEVSRLREDLANAVSLADQDSIRAISQKLRDDPLRGFPRGEWIENSGHGETEQNYIDWRFESPFYITVLPVAESWKALACLKYGGRNNCPGAVVSTAFLKHWNESYGAELVAVSRESIQFAVTRPPLTPDHAYVLAEQHAFFCADLLDVVTLDSLAAGLLMRHFWSFWWD